MVQGNCAARPIETATQLIVAHAGPITIMLCADRSGLCHVASNIVRV
ncbi:MAG: hypothetical protein ABSC95_08020 [Acetobacteraceae bacterium]|jgi:hypothetical protein